MIDNYNKIVKYSNKYDGRLDTSDKLLIACGWLCIEVMLIQSNTLHQMVFKNVGPSLSKLGLLKLNNICQPCVSQAMKTAYWESKNFAIEEGSDLWSEMMNGTSKLS